MSTSFNSTLSGGTGLDVGATVDQLMQVERAPEQLWKVQQQTISAQASALRDLNGRLETLETRTNTLKDLSGVFGQLSAESADESVFAASADATASAGDHIISVTQLATVASQYSDIAFSSVDSTFTSGDIRLQLGGGDVQTITLDENHATLAKAVDYINSHEYGVHASLANDAKGVRLVLVSKTAGQAGDLTVLASPDGLSFRTGTAGQNAKLTVDGVPVESSTNKISGALTGVTLQLNGDTSGIPTRLTIAPNTSASQQAIKNFVSAYNDIVTRINGQFQYDAASKSSGILAGDGTVRGLQATLLALPSFELKGGVYSTLRSVGIEMQDDGTLKVNDTTLSAALNSDPAAIEHLFRNDEGTGFAQMLSSKLLAMTDSVNGSLVVDAKGLDNTYKSLSDQIDAFEVRMTVRQQQLTDEYTRIDVMLRQMTSLENQVSKQLESLA